MNPIGTIETTAEQRLHRLLSLCSTRLRNSNVELITKAFWRCYHAHKNQLRSSGEPYYTHPLEVAQILLEEIPIDSISVAAALLHDVIEDVEEYTETDMRAEFGEEVTTIVLGLTKISDIFADKEIKEAENFRKILLSTVSDIRTILIKFCDRLHNMRTLDSLPSHRKVKIATQTRDIYAPFAHRFGLFKIKVELEDLSFKHLNPEEYDTIVKQLEALDAQMSMIKNVIEPIRDILTENKFAFEILARRKGIFSIHKKIIQRGKTLNRIYDIYGIRIILKDDIPSQCYAVYGHITYNLFRPVPDRFKDYIALPKKNGYQSIHGTLFTTTGQIFEVQIRTQKMHEFAESGIAAHWRYKENSKETDASIDKMLTWAKDLLASDESSKSFMEAFQINLDHREIIVFTPKGDTRSLPKDATVLDFAFDVHTQIGMNCMGAKINGKIVPIRQKLNSGDQVEILTAKTSRLSADWEKFVVSSKAKTKIRQILNEEKRINIEAGKEIWNKYLQKHTEDSMKEFEFTRFVRFCGYQTHNDFYIGLQANDVELTKSITSFFNRAVAKSAVETKQEQLTQKEISHFNNAPISIEGLSNIAFDYAKCCSPVPGDAIIGMVTTDGKIKIHRNACHNINNENVLKQKRLVNVTWRTQSNHTQFRAALNIFGFDRMGLTNELTNVILKSEINIQNIVLDTHSSTFNGSVILSVQNLEKLNSLISSILQIEGITNVERAIS